MARRAQVAQMAFDFSPPKAALDAARAWEVAYGVGDESGEFQVVSVSASTDVEAGETLSIKVIRSGSMDPLIWARTIAALRVALAKAGEERVVAVVVQAA